MTYDLDLVVALDKENLGRVEQILEEMELLRQQPLSLSEFADAEVRATTLEEKNLVAITFTDPNNSLREVDVLVNVSIDPSLIVQRAVTLQLKGVEVRVIALADLIELKRKSGRTQDLDDVKLLERIQENRDESSD